MNQDNKKQQILAGALGVVLVLVLVYQFVIKGTSAPPPKAPAQQQAQTQTASAKPATGGAAGATAASDGPARLKKVDVNLDELLKNINVVTFIYDNERISRNPMTPLVGRVLAPSGTQLQEGNVANTGIIRSKTVSGIIYNEFNPVAIVDDQVITEGYQYSDGVVVTQIEPKRVWFKWNDSLIPVDLKEL